MEMVIRECMTDKQTTTLQCIHRSRTQNIPARSIDINSLRLLYQRQQSRRNFLLRYGAASERSSDVSDEIARGLRSLGKRSRFCVLGRFKQHSAGERCHLYEAVSTSS